MDFVYFFIQWFGPTHFCVALLKVFFGQSIFFFALFIDHHYNTEQGRSKGVKRNPVMKVGLSGPAKVSGLLCNKGNPVMIAR